MNLNIRILFTLATLTILSSCTGSNGEPTSDGGVDSPIKAEQSHQPGISKYSPKQNYYNGGSAKDDWIKNPTKDLPNQSLYTASNSRSNLIDHFIANDPPQFIPLTSWKYDFIAGELALNALDLPEAKKMFELSLGEAAKEKDASSQSQIALSKARLGLVARLGDNYDEAEKFFKESLPQLEASAAEDNFELAAIISLYELALISSKKNDMETSSKWLQRRVALRERYHGKFAASLAALLNDYGNSLFYQRKFAEAEKVYLRALMIAVRFTKDSDYRNMAFYNLANCAFAEGKYADALDLYQHTNDSRASMSRRLQECRDKIAVLPDAEKKPKILLPALGDPAVWRQLLDSARVQSSFDKSWEAKKTLEAALDEAKAISPNGQEIPSTQIRIADLMFQQQNIDEARKMYEAVWERLKADPKNKEQASEALSRILLCQLCRGESSAAGNSFKELKSRASSNLWISLIPVLEQCNEKRMLNFDNSADSREVMLALTDECVKHVPNQNTINRAVAVANRARAVGRSDDEKCAEIFKQALSIAEKSSDKDPLRMYKLQMNAGSYLMAAQQYVDAEKCFNSALAYAEKNPGKENRQLLNTIEMTRALYSNWKKPDEEEVLLKRKIALNGEQTISPESKAMETKSELLDMARIARAKGDLVKAAEYLENAAKAEQANPNSLPSEARDLITVYEQAGNWPRVQFWHEQIASLLPTKNDQQYDQELNAAALYAAKSGSYEKAAKLIQVVISDMESRHETKVQDFGCYQSTPSYPDALRLLGNCVMDGESNYDKAYSIYSKELKSLQPGSGADPVGPAELSDNRLRSESDSPSPRPQSTPGQRHVNALGQGARQLHLSSEQLTNFVICCDAIGNKSMADKYRAELKSRLDDAINRQLRSDKGLRNPHYDKALLLLMKEKRNKDDELQLMGLVPRVLNSPTIYSGNVDGLALLERVIAWKIQKGESARNDLINDYGDLVALLMSNRRFNEAVPYSARKIALLVNTHASDKALADANLVSARLDQECGSFALASQKYAHNLQALKEDKGQSFDALINLSYCLQMQENYSDAIKYLREALPKAGSLAEKNDIHVRLGALFDITNNAGQATAEYKLVIPDAKDSYSAYEPLRNASEYQAQLKHFQTAEALYRRQASLLGQGPSSALGISNAYSQMARMYKYARKFDKAKQAYELAITALKTNPSDSFCQSQVQTMQKEMSDMK